MRKVILGVLFLLSVLVFAQDLTEVPFNVRGLLKPNEPGIPLTKCEWVEGCNEFVAPNILRRYNFDTDSSVDTMLTYLMLEETPSTACADDQIEKWTSGAKVCTAMPTGGGGGSALPADCNDDQALTASGGALVCKEVASGGGSPFANRLSIDVPTTAVQTPPAQGATFKGLFSESVTSFGGSAFGSFHTPTARVKDLIIEGKLVPFIIEYRGSSNDFFEIIIKDADKDLFPEEFTITFNDTELSFNKTDDVTTRRSVNGEMGLALKITDDFDEPTADTKLVFGGEFPEFSVDINLEDIDIGQASGLGTNSWFLMVTGKQFIAELLNLGASEYWAPANSTCASMSGPIEHSRQDPIPFGDDNEIIFLINNSNPYIVTKNRVDTAVEIKYKTALSGEEKSFSFTATQISSSRCGYITPEVQGFWDYTTGPDRTNLWPSGNFFIVSIGDDVASGIETQRIPYDGTKERINNTDKLEVAEITGKTGDNRSDIEVNSKLVINHGIQADGRVGSVGEVLGKNSNNALAWITPSGGEGGGGVAGLTSAPNKITIDRNFEPDTNATRALGSSSVYWSQVYANSHSGEDVRVNHIYSKSTTSSDDISVQGNLKLNFGLKAGTDAGTAGEYLGKNDSNELDWMVPEANNNKSIPNRLRFDLPVGAIHAASAGNTALILSESVTAFTAFNSFPGALAGLRVPDFKIADKDIPFMITFDRISPQNTIRIVLLTEDLELFPDVFEIEFYGSRHSLNKSTLSTAVYTINGMGASSMTNATTTIGTYRDAVSLHATTGAFATQYAINTDNVFPEDFDETKDINMRGVIDFHNGIKINDVVGTAGQGPVIDADGNLSWGTSTYTLPPRLAEFQPHIDVTTEQVKDFLDVNLSTTSPVGEYSTSEVFANTSYGNSPDAGLGFYDFSDDSMAIPKDIYDRDIKANCTSGSCVSEIVVINKTNNASSEHPVNTFAIRTTHNSNGWTNGVKTINGREIVFISFLGFGGISQGGHYQIKLKKTANVFVEWLPRKPEQIYLSGVNVDGYLEALNLDLGSYVNSGIYQLDPTKTYTGGPANETIDGTLYVTTTFKLGIIRSVKQLLVTRSEAVYRREDSSVSINLGNTAASWVKLTDGRLLGLRHVTSLPPSSTTPDGDILYLESSDKNFNSSSYINIRGTYHNLEMLFPNSVEYDKDDNLQAGTGSAENRAKKFLFSKDVTSISSTVVAFASGKKTSILRQGTQINRGHVPFVIRFSDDQLEFMANGLDTRNRFEIHLWNDTTDIYASISNANITPDVTSINGTTVEYHGRINHDDIGDVISKDFNIAVLSDSLILLESDVPRLHSFPPNPANNDEVYLLNDIVEQNYCSVTVGESASGSFGYNHSTSETFGSMTPASCVADVILFESYRSPHQTVLYFKKASLASGVSITKAHLTIKDTADAASGQPYDTNVHLTGEIVINTVPYNRYLLVHGDGSAYTDQIFQENKFVDFRLTLSTGLPYPDSTTYAAGSVYKYNSTSETWVKE